MLVALGYPVSRGVGLWHHNVGSEIASAATLPYLAWIVTLVAVGLLCLWGPWWSPESALRATSWLWISMSILLFLLLGRSCLGTGSGIWSARDWAAWLEVEHLDHDGGHPRLAALGMHHASRKEHGVPDPDLASL